MCTSVLIDELNRGDSLQGTFDLLDIGLLVTIAPASSRATGVRVAFLIVMRPSEAFGEFPTFDACTYLLSEESMSSTASQATRASGEVAPYFFDASRAAATAAEESTRALIRAVVDRG